MGLVHSAFHLVRNSTQRKHFFRWFESFQKDYLFKRKQPWLAFDAIDFLNSLSLENKRVFEYGSGGSTLYWLSRNMLCVSVEHDKEWFELVCTYLDKSSNIDQRLILPEKSVSVIQPDVSDPLLYLSDDRRFNGYNFKSYVSQIDGFDDNYFDVVLIDGRARPSCIMHSALKVKVNGIIILDNADRLYYTKNAGNFLQDFECLPFFGVAPSVYEMYGTNVYIRKK